MYTSLRRHLNRQTAKAFAYVALAGFTAYSFTVERRHSNQNKVSVAASTKATARQLAGSTYDVLVQGCFSGNTLREQLNERNETFHRVVINTDKLFGIVARTPGVTPDFKTLLNDAAAENERIASSVAALPDRDCVAAYAKLRPAGHPIPKPDGN